MAGPFARARRAAVGGGLGALICAVTVWINLRAGGGGAFIGHGPELTPTLPVTEARLALGVLGPAVALVPPLALMAAFSGPWPFRALAGLMAAAGWYWLGETVTGRFSAEGGAAWLPGEAFDALFYRPVLTPALWAVAVAGFVAVLGRINRPPKTTGA